MNSGLHVAHVGAAFSVTSTFEDSHSPSIGVHRMAHSFSNPHPVNGLLLSSRSTR